MTYELHTNAVLNRDIAEHDLRVGDVVKIIDYHAIPDGEDGCSIEVFNALGDSMAVTGVPESFIRPFRQNDVLCVRRRAHAPS